MLENCAPAPRAERVQYRVPACEHTRASLVRIRALRRHAVLHAMTYGRIMYDAVLVCMRSYERARIC